MTFDVLIHNGNVVDGSGNPQYKADIGIKGAKIIFIGNSSDKQKAERVIDASSLTIIPGLIDTHSHSDLWLLTDPYAEAKIRQGVTTEIVGNCGLTPSPLWGPGGELIKEHESLILGNFEIPWGWEKMSTYLNCLAKANPAVNVGCLFGHNNLRASVTGKIDSKISTKKEIEEMKTVASQAMEDGALGFSTGLGYPPGIWAEQKEIVELAKVVGKYNGVYATHMRNSGKYFLASVEEAIDVARQAEVHLHLSHLKSVGEENWGKVKAAKALLDQALSSGISITADVYPYTSGSGYLQTFLPIEMFEGGQGKVIERLKESIWREKVRNGLLYNIPWEKVVIISVASDNNRNILGESIRDIAANRGKDPIEVVFDLIIEEEGHVLMNMSGMLEDDVKDALTWQNSMIGSDGLPKVGPMCHPRTYGTFVRILSNYVNKEGLFSFESAIRKMTSLPAETFGLTNRGLIKKGAFADLVVLNPEAVDEPATTCNPSKPPNGLNYVLVNGKVVLENQKRTSSRPGMVLYGPGK